MLRKILLTVLTLSVLATPLLAQEEAFTCDPAGLEMVGGQVVEILATGDFSTVESALAALDEARAALAEARVNCDELSFSSDELGMLTVIGPITIPVGAYLVNVETEGFLILRPTTLEGDCLDLSIVSISEGQASGGMQTVYESEGCRMLLEVSNTRDPWTISFERVS